MLMIQTKETEDASMGQSKNKAEERMIRGSLLRWRRKCGGKNCHCASGELHESWALSCSVDGRTRVISLRDEDVEGVRAALERYRLASRDLEERAMEGLRELRAGIVEQRQRRRG